MPKAQLLELYAEQLGVIEEASLEFGGGFTVLTGETGAGKTLLLGALGLCLGGDAAASRYALTPATRVRAIFGRGDEELAFARESGATGRLKSSLNGVPSSAEALRVLAEELIVIHGQHDSLRLKNRSDIVALLDRYGNIDASDLEHTRALLRDARRLRDGSGGDESQRAREREFVEYQLREISDARITSPHELRDTLAELTRLSELRDGQESLARALGLFDADAGDGALDLFARALEQLPPGELYEPARASLSSALTSAREAVRELGALRDPDAFDDEILETLGERARVLQVLARKYGGTLEDVVVEYESLSERLANFQRDQERLAGLDEEIRTLLADEATQARRVRAAREGAAEKLSDAVRAQLGRVALGHAELRLVVEGDDGADVEILFRPNPGQPEGPLSSLASGGELSRVLLALSLETADEDVVAVFDEIDAGLGGEVAQRIGECLAEVGRRQQVLAITHLASVAARADHHFVIEKVVDDARTSTIVRPVNGDERTREIARMLAGDHLSDASVALAEQLLKNSSSDHPNPDFSY